MQLIPAIDLLGGRVVRLSQGAYDKVTAYADDPVMMARHWQAEGAERIHVVDLDAARTGRPLQSGQIARIVGSLDVPCQVAGGLRAGGDVAETLAAGADRVVLGSALIDDPAFAERLVAEYGADHIVAALDVRDGRALGDGWVSGARGMEATALAKRLADAGMRWFAVTAIARDGQQTGPDIELLERVREVAPAADIIASGGIGTLADVTELSSRGFAAAIVGRALYEGTFTLPEALGAALPRHSE